MNVSNVDTDMIIPAQFLKTIKRSGLGEYVCLSVCARNQQTHSQWLQPLLALQRLESA
jgi:3-isopropylmalate dehydratase small subunit